MKIGDVKNTILDGLRPFAEENGFKVNKGKFGIFLKEKERISSIDFTYSTWGFVIELSPYVNVKFKTIDEICNRFGYVKNTDFIINLLLLEEIKRHGWHVGLRTEMSLEDTDILIITDTDWWKERTVKKSPKAKDTVFLTTDVNWGKCCNDRIEKLLPYAMNFINEFNDIESIDRLYNALPISFYNQYLWGEGINHYITGIIAAKLSNNPQYDKIRDIYTSIVKKQHYFGENDRQAFFRIIDYLNNI